MNVPPIIAGPTPAFSAFPNKSSCSCSDSCTCSVSTSANLEAQDPQVPDEATSRRDNVDPNSQQKLAQDEQQKVKQLKARDREVRAHEAAHKAAGAGLTGPASYSFTTGPDGSRYAVGGEVSVDTSTVSGDPQATLLKANRIRAAALAPAEPSSQDLQVAAQAAQMAAAARQELTAQHHAKSTDKTGFNNLSKPHSLYQKIAAVNSRDLKGSQVDYTV